MQTTTAPARTSPVVGVAAVRRSFGPVVALDGVSVTVEPGEIVGLLGHNGAGKSTLVRLVLGILAPDAGTIRVLGLDPLTDGRRVRMSAGLVSANPAVDDRLTARQNLRFVASVFGVEPDRAARMASSLLEMLGLDERADEPVAGFSTGMRQRLALARALLPDPTLLLLDEPTAALDPIAGHHVRELITRLARDEGRSILLCSHNLAEAQQLCDRVLILERGRMLAQGTPTALAGALGLDRLRVVVDPANHTDALRVLVRAGDITGERTGNTTPGVLRVRGVASAAVPAMVAGLVEAGVRVHEIAVEQASLADAYFALHEGRVP